MRALKSYTNNRAPSLKRERPVEKIRRRLENNIKTGVHGEKFENEGLLGFEYGAFVVVMNLRVP
jgi:hypothetical protein